MEKMMDKANRKFNSRMQASLLLVFCIVTLLMIGLMARLVYIVQIDGDRYTKQVLSRQTYVSSVLPYKRGDILDVNGTVLAHSELYYRLILDPKLLLLNKDCIEPTEKALKKSFGIEEKDIEAILEEKPDKQYVIVKRPIEYELVNKFKKATEKEEKITGVYFEEEYVRSYPYKTLACDLIGFTNSENKGFYGIEEYYSDELNGTNGREYGYYDAELDIERIVNKAKNGNSIVTTINADVQRIIQEKINKFNSEIGTEGELGVGILVMDPNDGGIIAMASNKEYDLNSPRDLEGAFTENELAAMTEEEKTTALNSLWKNDAISSAFEPGSTFKPVTVASALEEDVISDSSTFYCDGVERKGGYDIHCSHVHGNETLAQAVMNSCNDAMMHIADSEGKNLFYKYEKSFGFGQKTGIDLPGEGLGDLLSLDELGEAGLATSSFGQSTTSTMIQVAAAFSSIVNGGYYYQPHVLKQIVNDSGATVKKFDKQLVRRTISEKTSDLLQEYLYQTVEAGTAAKARVEGYTIGGKTGTAEKLPRDHEKYIVSFIGCSPAINPKMVLYVTIDEPKVEEPSSRLATEFAGEIFKAILPVLQVYPEGEIDYLLPTLAPTPTPSANQQNTQGDNGGNEAVNGENGAGENTSGNEENGAGGNAENNEENGSGGNTQNNEENGSGDNAENNEENGAGDNAQDIEGNASEGGDTNEDTAQNDTHSPDDPFNINVIE